MIAFKSCLKNFLTRDNVLLAFSTLLLLLHLIFLAYDISHCNTVESAVNDAIVDDKYVSMTLCSNVPIKREFGTAPKVDPAYQEYYDEYDAYSYFDNYFNGAFENIYVFDFMYWNVTHLTKKNEMELLSEMVKFDEEQRMFYSLFPHSRLEISANLDSIGSYYKIDHFKLLLSNNLFYGNCITFNPSLYKDVSPNDDVIGIDIINDVLQHRNGLAEQPDMPWKREILVIHPINTEPIFDSRNIIKVPVNSKIIVTVTKTAYAHETDCEEENDSTSDEDNSNWGQFKDERNYTYSYEGCLASCLQNLTVEFCSCQLPHLQPINSMRMCRGCRLIPQTLLDDQCGCKYPCRSLDLRVSTESLTPEFHNDELSKFKKARYNQVLNLGKNLTLKSSKIKPKGNTEINILLPKLANTKLVETKCKFVVVLSQIGGILSLYIGLSIVSFVEMLMHLVLKRIYDSHKREKNASKYSLSVSNQFLNSKFRLKIFWILVLLATGCATFAQTWTLIQRYNQFPIVNQIQEIELLEFPSVTVCSNNLLTKRNYNFSITDLMSEQQKEIYENEKNHSKYGNHFDAVEILGFFIKQNSTADRMRRGPTIDRYVPTCYYSIKSERVNCSKMIALSIGSYGNCVTINSGISNEDDIERNIEHLTMELKLTEPEFLSHPLIFGTSVIIHPKGTSPNNYKFGKVLEIPPSYIYEAAFTLTIVEREPEPYPSKCVTPTSPHYQWMNVFHSHETPYLYTKQSCESSCEFNKSKLYESPEYYKYELQGREEFPLKLYSKYDNFFFGAPTASKCECRTPCREAIIETEVMKNVRISSHSSEVFNISALSSSWLTIRPKSRKITLIKEIPAIQLWTLISEIGGTIGLYIGASLLAFIELNSALIFKLFKFN